VAREIAAALGAREPKIVSGPEMMSKYVGESEAFIRGLFGDAELEQVYIDPIYMRICIYLLSIYTYYSLYVHIHIYLYFYLYLSLSLSLSLSLYIYIYIYIYICAVKLALTGHAGKRWC